MTKPATPNRNIARAYGDIAHAFKQLRRTLDENGGEVVASAHANVMEDAYLRLAVKYEADANFFGED